VRWLWARASWGRAAKLGAFALAFWAAVRVGFGLVFAIISAIALIWTKGLGDTRKAGDMSAWSVFNEGFEGLLGTLRAEQFDNEIRHRDVDAQPVGQEPVDPVDMDEMDVDDGADEGRGPAAGARRSGKKARRRYDKEERRRKRETQRELRGEQDGDY
jgi:hypothetical protein